MFFPALFMDAHQIVGQIGFEMSGHIDDVTFVEFSVFNVALFLLHMMFVHLFLDVHCDKN
jgi:hypothetical protein